VQLRQPSVVRAPQLAAPPRAARSVGRGAPSQELASVAADLSAAHSA